MIWLLLYPTGFIAMWFCSLARVYYEERMAKANLPMRNYFITPGAYAPKEGVTSTMVWSSILWPLFPLFFIYDGLSYFLIYLIDRRVKKLRYIADNPAPKDPTKEMIRIELKALEKELGI